MSESIQHRLDHVRPPRVQITYDVEVGNAQEIVELPYVLGIVSDLSGASVAPRLPLKDRKFVHITNDNLGDIMKSLQPRVAFSIPDGSGKGSMSVDLTFTSMNDFDPINVLTQVPVLKDAYAKRVRLKDLIAKLEVNDSLGTILDGILAEGKGGSSDEIIKQSNMVLNANNADYAKAMLDEFLSRAGKGGSEVKDSFGFINVEIQKIDQVISTFLNSILHNPAFQKLEASWRGLFMLVSGSDVTSRIQIRLLNVTREELARDLVRAVEFDQSNFFKKVYEEEYGTFGGSPYSFLMGDFEFGPANDDVALLTKISQVAAAAHTPFITAASPGCFTLKSFSELGNPRDLSVIFESTDLGKWQSFRETEDSRYVALTLPHILMRMPYGPNGTTFEGLNFVEDVDGSDNSKFCWGNSAWAMSLKILSAVTAYSWPAAIRGVEGGGLVEGLPYYTFKTTDGDVALKCPTEIAVTDRREKELSDLGFIALCHCKNRDYAAFFGSQTAQKPKLYDTDDANNNAELSARLSYLLCASRFAHYIKAMMRDKVGSFMSAKEVQNYLHNWICRYVLLTDEAGQTTKAKFPLREARVDVFDIPGKPGSYRATIFLRPHFQLEELTASIRLVANLPKPAAQ